MYDAEEGKRRGETNQRVIVWLVDWVRFAKVATGLGPECPIEATNEFSPLWSPTTSVRGTGLESVSECSLAKDGAFDRRDWKT